MRITPVQRRALLAIQSAPGEELEASKLARITVDSLFSKGLVKAAPRLYFGPRTFRLRLTQKGKEIIQ